MGRYCASAVAFVAFACLATPAHAEAARGGRIEAIVGWDRASYSLRGAGIDLSLHATGIVFGIGGGYDFAVGNRVSLGVDLEASESTADLGEITATTAKVSVGRDLYAGGRVTVAASPAVNIYLKAGYTNGTLTFDDGTNSDSVHGDGVRAGIGAQVAIGRRAYMGAEYRYSNYQDDLSRNQVVATLGFRF